MSDTSILGGSLTLFQQQLVSSQTIPGGCSCLAWCPQLLSSPDFIVHTYMRLPPQAFAFIFWNYRYRFAQFSNFLVNSQAKWKQEKQPRCELLQYLRLPFLFIWLHQANMHLYKLMYNADCLLLLVIVGCCSNHAIGMTFCGRKKKSCDLTDMQDSVLNA